MLPRGTFRWSPSCRKLSLTESATRIRVFESATGGIDASMLSQALCRLCCGKGHHRARASLFCALLSPLQAVLQAAHVIFVCFGVKSQTL